MPESVKVSSGAFKSILGMDATKHADPKEQPDNISFIRRFSKAEAKSYLNELHVKPEVTRSDHSPAAIISYLKPIHQEVGNKRLDADKMRALAPEIEQSRILVSSSIMSPNDLQDGEFTFKFDGVPGLEADDDLLHEIAEVYDEMFNKTLQLGIKSYDWIGDIQYSSGCKPILILPIATQIDVKNHTVFDIRDKDKLMTGFASFDNYVKYDKDMYFFSEKECTWKDVLEKKDESSLYKDMVPSMESFGIELPGNDGNRNTTEKFNIDEFESGMEGMIVNLRKKLEEGDVIKISENPQILKFATKKKYDDKYQLYEKLQKKMQKDLQREEIVILKANPHGIPHQGHPTLIELPPESVIPIHVPGAPKEHIGYFVLIDGYGQPLTIENSGMMDTSTACKNGSSAAAYEAMFGSGCTQCACFNGLGGDKRMEAAGNMIFTHMFEAYLKARLKGIFNREDLTLSRFNAIATTLFYRVLDRKETTLLFVPTTLLHYLAFDYDKVWGTGKALSHSSKIKTPTGWTTMGDIKIGDQIQTPSGEIATVTNKYPQGIKQLYRIVFEDDRAVECDADHLWTTIHPVFNKHGFYFKEEILSTIQLIERLSRSKKAKQTTYIPICEKEKFVNDKEYIIHPYILGALLGDGCLYESNITITTDKEIIDKIGTLLPDNLCIKYMNMEPIGTCHYARIVRKKKGQEPNVFITELKRLGLIKKLSQDKFIPEEYLNGSYHQRLDLLQGLMDTDGCSGDKFISQNKYQCHGSIRFSTTSEQLALGVQYLIRSLGGLCKLRISYHFRKRANNDDYICTEYNLSIRYPYPQQCFSLNRKRDKLPLQNNYMHHFALHIKSVDAIPKYEECSCIEVDSQDHMFITNDFIATHNCKLDDIKFILSLRTTLLMANCIAMANDAVEHKKIEFGVDEKVANLEGIMDLIANIFIAKNKINGSVDPSEILNDLYSNALTIVPKGIPGLQDLSVDVTNSSGQSNRVDDQLIDKLNELLVSHLDVPPSALNSMNEPEFAKSLVTYNLFFAKKIARYQRIWCNLIGELIRTYSTFDIPFQHALLKKLEAAGKKKDREQFGPKVEQLKKQNPNKYKRDHSSMLKAIMENVTVSLATPNIVVDRTQYEELKEYMMNVEDMSQQLFSQDMVPQDDQSAQNALPIMRAKWKRDQLIKFIENVGNFNMVEVPNLDDTDVEEITDFLQVLQNTQAAIVQQRSAIAPEGEAGIGGGFGEEGGFGGGDEFGMGGEEDLDEDMSASTEEEFNMEETTVEEETKMNEETSEATEEAPTMFSKIYQRFKKK